MNKVSANTIAQDDNGLAIRVTFSHTELSEALNEMGN